MNRSFFRFVRGESRTEKTADNSNEGWAPSPHKFKGRTFHGIIKTVQHRKYRWVFYRMVSWVIVKIPKIMDSWIRIPNIMDSWIVFNNYFHEPYERWWWCEKGLPRNNEQENNETIKTFRPSRGKSIPCNTTCFQSR